MTVGAPVRKAAARATLTLPFSVPPQNTFLVRELAALCGMKDTFIEEQFDAGKKLSGFGFNGGAGKRDSKRIPRAWAIAFLCEHARWEDDTLADAYCAALRHFSREQLLRVREAVNRALTA